MKSRMKVLPPVKLQVTSLMDMFTIILVFLLVQITSEDYDFVRDETVDLPPSSVKGTFRPAVNVAVSTRYVKVGENVVAQLANGAVSDEWVKAGRIEGVVQAVRRARELRAKQPEGEEEILVIQADKTLPYKTVYLVLRSCSLAGYTRYRIAVLKE